MLYKENQAPIHAPAIDLVSALKKVETNMPPLDLNAQARARNLISRIACEEASLGRMRAELYSIQERCPHRNREGNWQKCEDCQLPPEITR